MNPVVQAANNIRGGLTVVQVLCGLAGLLGLVYVLFAVALGSSISANLPASLEGRVPPETLRTLFTALFALGGLLLLASSVAYIFVAAWVKDWEKRVADWTAGGRPDAARLERLRRTLGNWILVSQWTPVLGALIFAVLVAVAGGLVGALIGGFAGSNLDAGDPNAAGGLGSLAGAGALAGLALIVVFVFLAPQLVFNFLILGAIRRWMDAITDRVTGRPNSLELMGFSNIVSGWLTFTQVMVAILALLEVLSGCNTAGGTSDAADVLLVTLFVFVLNALLFMMLQWSKTFLFGVAGYAERYGTPSGGAGGMVDLGKR